MFVVSFVCFSLNVMVYTDCMCLDSVHDFSRAHTEHFCAVMYSQASLPL